MGIHPFPMLLSLLAAAVPISASASAVQAAAEWPKPVALLLMMHAVPVLTF